MPQVFQMAGSNEQRVSGQLPALSGMPDDLYIGCWIQTTATAPMYIGALMSGLDDINVSAKWGFYIDAEGYLCAQGTYLPNSFTIQSPAAVTFNDGNWHHIGAYIYITLEPIVVDNVTVGYADVFNASFYFDGQPVGAGATRKTGVKRGSLVGTSTPTPPTPTFGFSFGLAGYADSTAIPAMTGLLGNIVMQTGLMTLSANCNGVPRADVNSFVASTSCGIPVATPGTLVIIELLPSELNNGITQYTNLSTGLPLAIGSGTTVYYTSTTYLDGLSEMALYAPQVPFPGVANGTDPLSLAMTAIFTGPSQYSQDLRNLINGADVSALRACYTTLNFNWTSAQLDISQVPCPANPSGFSPADFQNAQNQLTTELTAVGQTFGYYNAAYAFLGNLQSADQANLLAVLPNLAANEASGTSSGNIGQIVGILADLLQAAAIVGKGRNVGGLKGSTLKLAAYLLEGLYGTVNLFDQNPSHAVTDPFGSFAGPFDTLVDQVVAKWQDFQTQLGVDITAITTNWGALQLVQYYYSTGQFQWQIANDDIPTSFAVSGQSNYMKALLPNVYQATSYPTQGYNFLDFNGVPSQVYTPAGPTGGYSGGSGYGTVNCTIGNPILDDYIYWDLENYPSQTSLTFLFGTGAGQLVYSAQEFWFQWPWTWTAWQSAGQEKRARK